MAEQLTSSWGCAREGRVWAGLRVVGKSRQISPSFGDIEINGFVSISLPAGTAQIPDYDSGNGAQKET